MSDLSQLREKASAGMTSHRPLVSIVMSMLNSSATIGAAIRSIQLQSLKDWELIVIDDGSTDGSAEIVRAIEDPRIRLVAETACAGLATRLNQAVAISRGDFIARMDADDICFPDRLICQVDNLQRNPAIDLVGCAAVVFADNLELIGTLPIESTHGDIVASPFSGFPFPHPTWCGRARWFRNNPYNPALMKAEDQDLLLRTFQHSQFAALAEVLVGYRQDVVRLKKRLEGRQATIRSLLNYIHCSNNPFPAVWGIAVQIIKSGLEIITIGVGFSKQVQRRRLKPVEPRVVERWLELQQALRTIEIATQQDAHALRSGRPTRFVFDDEDARAK
jgi:Glycosyl transferase family 2